MAIAWRIHTRYPATDRTVINLTGKIFETLNTAIVSRPSFRKLHGSRLNANVGQDACPPAAVVLPKGTVVKLNGYPCELAQSTKVYSATEVFETDNTQQNG